MSLSSYGTSSDAARVALVTGARKRKLTKRDHHRSHLLDTNIQRHLIARQKRRIHAEDLAHIATHTSSGRGSEKETLDLLGDPLRSGAILRAPSHPEANFVRLLNDFGCCRSKCRVDANEIESVFIQGGEVFLHPLLDELLSQSRS